MFSKPTISLIAALFLAGCSLSVQTEFVTATPQPVITATLPPSPTISPSQTPLPPPPPPTVVPVQGTTSTQLNVRAEPSTASEVLGIIAADQIVQIVGQDTGGNWWQIIYEAGRDGKGWVTAQFVETAGRPEVPVIRGDGENPSAKTTAVIIQQLNIRNGPGTSFDSLGVLNANDVVTLTGKNRDNSWLQIEFTEGLNGKGWVNAAFVRTDAVDALPIVSDVGDVVGTGTPMDTPPPPTPTLVPAPLDFDSAEAPLKTILFDRAGAETLIYNGDVSIPDGDPEDWIAFTPYNNLIFVSIQCTGNGMLLVQVAGSELSLACGDVGRALSVQADTRQLIHIEVLPASGSLQYVNYILTIKASQ